MHTINSLMNRPSKIISSIASRRPLSRHIILAIVDMYMCHLLFLSQVVSSLVRLPPIIHVKHDLHLVRRDLILTYLLTFGPKRIRLHTSHHQLLLQVFDHLLEGSWFADRMEIDDEHRCLPTVVATCVRLLNTWLRRDYL